MQLHTSVILLILFIGHLTYIRHKRRNNIDEHPRTPDPYEIQSKRAFEGRIKVWRRSLHAWDTKGKGK